MSVTKQQVAALYIAVYGRAPEASGLEFWSEEFTGSYAEAAAGFVTHPLFEKEYGELSNQEKVEKFYTNILGSEGDTAGIEYWVERLENGEDMNVVLSEFLNDSLNGDFSGDEDALVRQNTLKNKAEVGIYYAEKMGAASEFPEGTDLDSIAVESAEAFQKAKAAIANVDATEESVAAAIAAIDAAAPSEPDAPRDTVRLTVDQDDVVAGDSTSGTDFVAKIFDNQNTLQNGDSIVGGAGHDTLYAEVGNSQNFVIAPEVKDVETLAFSARADASSTDQSDNNLSGNETREGVQINGDYVVGATRWESNQSRADLFIEGVRIADNQETKDISVAFTDSQPGNVDFGLYFDPSALRAGVQKTDSITLTISNPLETARGFDASQPLADLPYDQFSFELNGVLKTIKLNLEGVKTYDDLAAALEAALAEAKAADSSLAGLELTREVNGQDFIARDGEARSADQFTLTVKNADLTPKGWNATGGLKPDNAFSATMDQGATSVDELITTNILLDNVGRGSTGGDMVVGSLSTGDTSNSRGVEQFDVVVDGTSKLRSLSSTNNTLEVITVTSGDVGGDGKLGSGYGKDFGTDLYIGGDRGEFGYTVRDIEENTTSSNGYNNPLKGNGGGSSEQLPGGNATEFGLVDVRQVSTKDSFEGNIHLSALLSADVAAKYLNAVGLDGNPRTNVVEFDYTLGNGNDSLYLEMSAENLAKAGTTTHSDFNLTINGGAGNDEIVTYINDGSEVELTVEQDAAAQVGFAHSWTQSTKTNSDYNTNNWYENSKANANLKINAGADNDVVKTLGSGDWVIDLGAGDDVLYADNTGAKTSWIYNLADPQATNFAFTAENGWENAIGVKETQFNLYKATATINFKGFKVEVTIDAGSDYKTSQTEINKAIADAIRNDEVLSKLLDVPLGQSANTLIINSLIDGANATELSIDIKQGILVTGTANPGEVRISTAEQAALIKAWGLKAPNDTLAGINAALEEAKAKVPFGSSNSAVANGDDSSHQADNTITGGTGDDVLVLGTGVESSDTVVYKGYENGTDTIVNFTTATTADGDKLDLTSYNADGLEQVIGRTTAQIKALVEAGGVGKFVYFNEDADNAGEYTVTVWEKTAAGVTELGKVGVLDFGDTITFDDTINVTL